MIEKHNYEIKEVDGNIGLDWVFYEVEKPNHNLKEYGIVISETFIVKKYSAERLTNYKQQLFDLENFK